MSTLQDAADAKLRATKCRIQVTLPDATIIGKEFDQVHVHTTWAPSMIGSDS
jgi:hypothetical protein